MTLKFRISFALIGVAALFLSSCEQENFYPDIIKHNIESDFGSSFELQIALPKDYDAGKNYNAVFIVDAEWAMRECVTAMSKTSASSNYIIFGLAYKGKNNRTNDFTPTVTTAGTGRADKLKTFIEEKIFQEYIPDHYPNVLPDRSNTIFAGHSLGGLFGSYLFLKNSDIFGKYLLISSSYMTDEQAIFGIELEEREQASTQNAVLYLATGSVEEYGFHATAQHFTKIVSGNYPYVQMKNETFKNSDHDGVRAKALEKGLSYLTAN